MTQDNPPDTRSMIERIAGWPWSYWTLAALCSLYGWSQIDTKPGNTVYASLAFGMFLIMGFTMREISRQQDA